MNGRDPRTRNDAADAFAYALRSRGARVNAIDRETDLEAREFRRREGADVFVRPRLGPEPRVRWLCHVACGDAPVFADPFRHVHVCAVCGYEWSSVELLQARSIEAIALTYRDIPIARIGELRDRGRFVHAGPTVSVPEYSETLAPPSNLLPEYKPR